ncbi:MAG: NAD+ synthase [Nitrospirales bacterium]
MTTLRLAMVQMNSLVGDLRGNAHAIEGWLKEAKQAKADVVVFPELALPGYPPEDLLLLTEFLREIRYYSTKLAKKTRGIMAVIGSVDEASVRPTFSSVDPSSCSKPLNVAWIMADGHIRGSYAKHKLPNYGVFDEQRYFQAGHMAPVFCLGKATVGVNICEDIWFANGPVRDQAVRGGANLVLNINASPYHTGKTHERQEMLASRAKAHRIFVSYTNMVGGQDELVFDGNSLVVDPTGKVIARGKPFEEDFLLVDITLTDLPRRPVRANSSLGKPPRVFRVDVPWKFSSISRVALEPSTILPPLQETEEIYRALVLGVADYVRKNQFSRVLIGISGGIDSALTAAIARDALGASQVVGVMMPSRYTSTESLQDSKALAKNLGIRLLHLPISKLFQTYLQLLEKPFFGLAPDVTEENLQARIRGTLLMALSNKFGDLVLTTGNKSEMSVGYATLYGDMAGGFAVIKDVPKTLVYQLARWRSRYKGSLFDRVVIPERIHTRAPSAELKPEQTDQDTLPPYSILDGILEAYVEENQSPSSMVRSGYASKVVHQVMRMVDMSEYKRRQSPVGIKISPRALGKDRRMPITNRYTSRVGR